MVTSPKTVNGEKCLSVVVYRTICQMHNSVYLFLSAVIFQIQAYSLCQTYVATTATIVCIVYCTVCTIWPTQTDVDAGHKCWWWKFFECTTNSNVENVLITTKIIMGQTKTTNVFSCSTFSRKYYTCLLTWGERTMQRNTKQLSHKLIKILYRCMTCTAIFNDGITTKPPSLRNEKLCAEISA